MSFTSDLKSADSGKSIFKPAEDDVLVIDLSDILTEPKAEQSGHRLSCIFEKKSDVSKTKLQFVT